MSHLNGNVAGTKYGLFPRLDLWGQRGQFAAMRQPEDLEKTFVRFDGRDLEPLRRFVSESLSKTAQNALLAACSGPDEVAATWIVKALVERGRLGSGQIARAFEAFAEVTAPDAVLHLLQCAQYAPDAAPILRPYLTPYYGHSRILIRAWAFDAYCRSAPADEDLGDRIRQGLSSRHGSIRARAKALARDFDVDLENGG